MPDLNTESPHVVRTLHTWVHDLVQRFNIDALRIDTVKHIRKDFWPDFVRAAGVAVMGEVLHGSESQGSQISWLTEWCLPLPRH
jgi:alpha-amylase